MNRINKRGKFMSHSQEFTNLWNQSNADFPLFSRSYDGAEKKRRENLMKNFVLSLKQRESKMCDEPDAKVFDELRSFFSDCLDYSSTQLEVIFSEDMVKAAYGFIQAARFNDPKISFHDVFQACRNVWIMNGLQFLFGQNVKLTPSIFAYSMLYPYTDNYIDDPAISTFEKYEFSVRFAERLSGNLIEPVNEQEVKVFRMVEIIEEEWSRQLYPQVYESLLEIHRTQTDSSRLIGAECNRSPEQSFLICINKGGASVIADGCLITGGLTEQQEDFLYAYGAYLQLLDDLQDVVDDLSDDLNTWHVIQAKKGKLEYALNKTWSAGQLVLQLVDELESPGGEVFKMLMSRSIDLFLLEAVIANEEFFTKKYSDKVESYSPFSFSFIRKRSGSFTPFQDKFFEKIEQFAMTNDYMEFNFIKKESLQNQVQQAN